LSIRRRLDQANSLRNLTRPEGFAYSRGMNQMLKQLTLLVALSLLLVNFNVEASHVHSDVLDLDCAICAHTSDSPGILDTELVRHAFEKRCPVPETTTLFAHPQRVQKPPARAPPIA